MKIKDILKSKAKPRPPDSQTKLGAGNEAGGVMQKPVPAKDKAARKVKTEDSPEKKAKRKKRLKKAIRNLCIKILVITLTAFSIWTWVGEIYIIHTNAMYPHIKDGALLVTSKVSGLNKGDVVLYQVFDYKEVGRIVGVPGDIVEISDSGVLSVNGQTPFENVFYQTTLAEGSPIEYPYKLRPGEYFVMNDMRETKEDSRIYGGIVEDELHGKVVFMMQHRGI